MPFIKSIGARIFGLAIFLLGLTLALVGFLLWQVSRLQGELNLLASRDLPLASSFSRIDEFGLRRRLAFERQFGELNAARPDKEIISEAEANYQKHTDLLQSEFAKAHAILDKFAAGDSGGAQLAEIAATFRQIEAAYPAITARQAEVLDLQRRGEHDRAHAVDSVLNDMQRLLQAQRAELQNKTASRAEAISVDATRRQRHIMILTAAATLSTVLLGLVVAGLVTDRLVRPVRALIGAIRDVQGGRLDLELPVRGNDELGALTSSFNYFVQELRSKAQMKETFGKYVDPRILERVLVSPGSADAAGGRHVMTISFGDLVGFTGLSERLTPGLMVKVLNRHFGLQAQAVQGHHGIVDKFIGDSVMAFWGPPFVAAEDHAGLACRAALAQLAAVDALRRELAELTGLRKDPPSIDIRVGIATGEAIVGNIGSDNTRSYTVIGDTVNLASRLEAANRTYGTRILVSEAVVHGLDSQFETRELDAIAVKGKTESARIFELLGEAGKVDGAVIHARDAFAEALRAYRAADWSAAESGFARCLALQPKDRPAQVMLDRVALMRQRPGSEPWDGVWRMESK